MDDPTANPFLDDLFVDHPANLPGVVRIHQSAFARVAEAVETFLAEGGGAPRLGRLFLVGAAAAGYGKSHLVARLRDHLAPVASTLHLPFDRSRPATWPVALSSTLRQLAAPDRSRLLPVALLDECSRFFLCRLVLESLAGGGMKSRDCPEEPARLQREFATLFSRDSDSRILPWVDKRAADLVDAADPGFSRRLGLGSAELGFWTRLFVDLNLRDEGALDRLRGLSNGEARERLLQLLRIATDLRPALVVADSLDGFHHSETAGMEIAEIVNGIREKAPRTVTLVCVNDDVWASAFAPRLPSAWLDRLAGEPLRLHPLGAEAARELVRFRLRRLDLSENAAARFAARLAEAHRWGDAETPLSPRRVLRQAAELWAKESGGDYAAPPVGEEAEYAAIAETPLEKLTDKAEFFAALQRDEPPVAPRETSSGSTPLPPPRLAEATAPPAPEPPKAPEPPRNLECELAAIDSIINDIRGTGKTVVSEAPEQGPHLDFRAPEPVAQEPAEPAPASKASPPPGADPAGPSLPESPPAAPVPLPKIPVIPPRQTTPAPVSFFAGFEPPASRPSPAATIAPPSPLTRASFERALAQRERELLSGPALLLDLERIARFVRAVGAKHPGLGQHEERYPSSRTVCLRWSARDRSVVVGFESPRNVYFWNNLLQQSLASNRPEKIAAFSHASAPFDPALFASFGFSPAVIRGRIDIIEMNDRELAMIYAAERTLREHQNSPESEKAFQFTALHLDPLWRRIVQPL